MRALRGVITRINSGGHSILFLLLWGICGALSGCGASVYEARLAESAGYFAYLEKLDRNLVDENLKQHGFLGLRIPNVFDVLPISDQIQEGNYNEIAPANGTGRQIELLKQNLPGLAGAWTAGWGDSAASSGPRAYLFALSNYQLFVKNDDKNAEPASNPLKFHEQVIQQMVADLNLQSPTPSDLFEEQYPRSAGYVAPKRYTVIRWPLERPNAVPVQAAEIDGEDYQIELYLAQSQQIEVALLYLIPFDLGGAGTQLNEQISLSLETVELASQAPVKSSGDRGKPSGRTNPQF